MSSEALTLCAVGLVMASAMIPRLSIDMAAVVAVGVLVIGKVLTPTEAAHGFGNKTLLTVACMFILAEALHRTGAADRITLLVKARAKKGMSALLLSFLPVVMVLSGIMSNTGVVVLLLPALITASQKMKISPSRLLLPLSYASITGGTLTLVGTTTTLLVDGILVQQGEPGLGLIEIMPMGALFCVIALIYLVIVGPKLLPDRVGLMTAITPGTTRQYMTEIVLKEGSQTIGRSVDHLRRAIDGIRVLEIVRGEETLWPPFVDVVLQEHDVVLVKGKPEEIVELLHQRGVLGPIGPDDEEQLTGVNIALAEVMVVPGSGLEGATVTGAGMRTRFGVVVLAVLRRGAHLREQIGSLKLNVGDILLVQGDTEAVRRLSNHESDMIRLGGTQPEAPNKSRAPLAIAIGSVALLGSAVGAIDLSIAVLLAAVALVAGGCLSAAQAYRSINLRIIVILGCMLGIGSAVESTGLADDVAGQLVALGGDFGPRGVLAMIYLATLLLTELVTNAATAGIMIPVAISTASQLEVSNRPFVFAIALAASCSFLTPVGYQTNLLVYGPGGYRLQDYLRLGAPLSLLLWIAGVLVLPLIFPF